MKKIAIDIYQTIRIQNNEGRFSDNQFLERNLHSIRIPEDTTLDKIITELVDEGYLLRYQYADDTLYVAYDKNCISQVLHGAVQKEIKTTESMPASTKDPQQKQMYVMKNSIIKKLRDELTEKLETYVVKDADSAMKVHAVNKKTISNINGAILQASKKFQNGFKVKNLSTLKYFLSDKNITTAAGVKMVEILLDAMAVRKDIVKIPVNVNDVYYIASKVIDKNFISGLSAACETAEKKAGSPPDGSMMPPEYQTYLALKTVLNECMSFAGQTGEIAMPEEAGASSESSEIPKVGDEPEEREKEPEKTPDDTDAAPDKNKIKSLFTSELSEVELRNELFSLITGEKNKEILSGYYDLIHASRTEYDKINNFKVFFDCVNVLIKVPGEHNQRLYEIAKELISRYNTILNNETLRNELEKIDNSYENCLMQMREEEYFRSRDIEAL